MLKLQGDFTAFDLHRMFLGENFSLLFVLEILFRTAIMYASAILLVRYLGKRGLGQLSPIEYVIVIAMGSAAGDPMFYPDVPLLSCIIVLATIVLLEKGLTNLGRQSERIERITESTPALLIRDGRLYEERIRAEGLARDEIFVRLREQGIENVAEVRLAFLEPSGNMSVFRRQARHFGGESTLPSLPELP